MSLISTCRILLLVMVCNYDMYFSFRPEAQGVICGAVFLITIFLFIPFPFYDKLLKADLFPFNEVCIMIDLALFP